MGCRLRQSHSRGVRGGAMKWFAWFWLAMSVLNLAVFVASIIDQGIDYSVEVSVRAAHVLACFALYKIARMEDAQG